MYKKYTAKNYSLKKDTGLSQKQIDIHLGLYQGYVTQYNSLIDTLEECKKNNHTKAFSECNRRINFELAGIKNHELYFDALTEEGVSIKKESEVYQDIIAQYGTYEAFIAHVKQMALTRGIGWVLCVHDQPAKAIHVLWVADHELGGIALPAFLAVDMWEHAFLIDYTPAEKGTYIDTYLSHIKVW
ncbi:MAG: Fe-Mn family superoxide dismutase [Alphaproteobacteria bacterium]|nr:Fe-Mn family superoxide dismutase [Alphaproteobacteria bacterium]